MVHINEYHTDVGTPGGTKMRVFIFHPVISGYPNAKFPGVIVWSEIYQGTNPLPQSSITGLAQWLTWGFLTESVTGPVSRFARQIAGQGYICAAPSVYHDFEGPEAFAYDVPGTDKGNDYKVKKVGSIARYQ